MNLNLAIHSHEIVEINFHIDLAYGYTSILMIDPYEKSENLALKKAKITEIFGRVGFIGDSSAIPHFKFSERTFSELRNILNTLKEKSLIDSEKHQNFINSLQTTVDKVKNILDEEIARYAQVLTSASDLLFSPVIRLRYKDLEKNLMEGVMTIDNLVKDLYFHRGNFHKIPNIRTTLIESKNVFKYYAHALQPCRESYDVNALLLGVRKFLSKYDNEFVHL